MNIGDGSDYVGAWTFLLPKVAPSQPSTEWRRIADMTRAALSHLLDQALLQFPLAVTSETRAERELQITTECIAVPEQLAAAGAIPVRSKVGHSNIKAQMAELNAVFGGEHSAHFYFRDFYFADSGMLAAMHVLAALGETDATL